LTVGVWEFLLFSLVIKITCYTAEQSQSRSGWTTGFQFPAGE